MKRPVPPKNWRILQKNSDVLWRQITLTPSSKMMEEKNLIIEQRAVHEFPEPPTLMKTAVSSMRSLFYRTMLPVGYPETVHPNYIKFNFWGFVQGVMGSASGVLSTQCLLVGLGMAGHTSSAFSGGGTIALAATLNWVLKDGIGNLGGILFVSKFGDAFDRDAKRYRFLSAFAMNIATVLELIVPLVPHLFLPLASMANTCKSISWMANSATRAQIQRHFTRIDNLGDLTGKAASLNTAAMVCGTGIGVALSSVFLTGISGTATGLVNRCLAISLPLMAFYLWANYRSCLLSVSPRLTLQRIDIIMKELASSVLDPSGNPMTENIKTLSRYILCPSSMGKRERFLYWRRDDLSSVRFEPPATLLCKTFTDDHMADSYSAFFERHGFVASFDRDGKLSVWFSDETESLEEILVNMFAVYLARIIYKKGSAGKDWIGALEKGCDIASGVGLVEALKAKQWDLDPNSLPRKPIVFKSV